ncbi:MAG: cyclic lactone autoinducer peptide [Clostridiaceae bacterium]
MKKLNKKALMLIATLTTLLASTVASSACLWMTYQPEEPNCLREE